MHDAPPARRRRPLRTLRRALTTLVVAIALVVAGVYAWPLSTPSLQRATHTTLDYAAAVAAARARVAADTADTAVEPACRTRLLVHGARTARAVLLLHGYTACTSQYAALAQQLYDAGYNVYAPLAPRHGTDADSRVFSDLRAEELTHEADAAATVLTGLGDETGVVGLSGGATQALWLAAFRPEVVRRLVLVSPFFRPASARAPGWQLKPLTVVYGYRLLPDRFTDADHEGFSYRGLGQYLRVLASTPPRPSGSQLLSLGLLTSPGDTEIDRAYAVTRTEDLAAAAGVTPEQVTLPAAWGTGHDVLTPGGDEAHGHDAQISAIVERLLAG